MEQLHRCTLVLKCLNLVPDYLCEYFTRNSNIHNYNTRQKHDLHLPKPNRKLDKKTFRFSGTRHFNALPAVSADATVMTGLTGGVPTLFKNEQPCLQAIHCYAHRLELAYKDALKKLTLYGTSSNPLLNLYLSYHHSPLNRSNLKTIFETLSLPLVLSKLSLVAQTKAATVADVHASFTSVSWLHKHKAKPTPKEHSLSLSLNMDEVPTFHGDQL